MVLLLYLYDLNEIVQFKAELNHYEKRREALPKCTALDLVTL